MWKLFAKGTEHLWCARRSGAEELTASDRELRDREKEKDYLCLGRRRSKQRAEHLLSIGCSLNGTLPPALRGGHPRARAGIPAWVLEPVLFLQCHLVHTCSKTHNHLLCCAHLRISHFTLKICKVGVRPHVTGE